MVGFPQAVVALTVGHGLVAKLQALRRRNVRRRRRLAAPSEDVEHDVGAAGATVERLGAGLLNRIEAVLQHRRQHRDEWRFVEDEALRERLREAKGIGTPATRAEIISGLKKQGFLAAQGKNILPTDRGLALFGVLKRADPALVDPGVTAELECLLDDVLTGRQEMTRAIDAVCDSARRIIGRLGEHGAVGKDVILGGADGSGGDRPPTARMRKFAASFAKSKGIKAPAGYTKSAALCRAFLDEHAPRRNAGQGEATRSSDGTAAIPSRGGKPRKAEGARLGTEKPKATAPRRGSGLKRARTEPSAGAARRSAGSPTPLHIPYGNKEVAFSMGARYGADGWYAPPGVDLDAFRERGWL